ncbi:c-type cytochrome [Thalassolituus sp.]|jgi:hypothetical protein
MNNIRGLLLLLGLLTMLTGCERFSDDLEDDGYNAVGHALYQQQCASCHGIDGNGTSIGPTLVGCATCSSFLVLADEINRTMPVGDVEACTDSCARDTAEYILYAFNGKSLADAKVTIEGVATDELAVTLRKASLQLAGRMPTSAEIAAVEAEGEVALSAALDTLMQEDTFYDVLMETFNQQLLTDKYLTRNLNEGGINLLDTDDFPGRKWYNDQYSGDDQGSIRGCLRAVTNDAVAREPLELVSYAARNELPHTLFMTADFMMVNWYSQQVYEAELLDRSVSFRQLDEPVCDANGVQVYYDPTDFRPARVTKDLEHELGGFPHAGILTSPMFLNRFPTTDTNRNRHRARKVFDFFLDTDILAIEGERPGDGIGNGSDNPTLLDPACYSCHQIMDPVSSAFQHWTDRGQYITTGRSSANRWDGSDIEPPGLGGESTPLSGSGGYFRNLLQWLGQKIAQDPRFVRATVRTLYTGLVGQPPLIAPGEGAAEADILAFNSQRAILNDVGDVMVAGGWDVKEAVKAIILSPYYRARAVDSETLVANSHIGSSQFISPERLHNKLVATLGFGWDDFRWEDNRIMFGGMDSDSIIERITDPGGLIVAIQSRMASEMACRATAYDFLSPATERRLFPNVETITEPDTPANIARIRENIRHLHWVLLGERIAADDPEVDATYNLFVSVMNQGQEMLDNPDAYSPSPSTYLEWECRARWERQEDGRTGDGLPSQDRIEQDSKYTLRAWIAVMTYLLSDFRFIFE